MQRVFIPAGHAPSVSMTLLWSRQQTRRVVRGEGACGQDALDGHQRTLAQARPQTGQQGLEGLQRLQYQPRGALWLPVLPVRQSVAGTQQSCRNAARLPQHGVSHRVINNSLIIVGSFITSKSSILLMSFLTKKVNLHEELIRNPLIFSGIYIQN